MTESPPPPPPAVAGRGSRCGGWIAAVVIAASVTIGITQAWWDKQAAAEAGSGMEVLKMEIEARYLVGMNQLVGSMVPESDFPRRGWLAPFEAAVHSDKEVMRLAILEGEIIGSAEARETLRRIKDPSPPIAEDRAALERIYESGSRSPLTEAEAGNLRQRHGWLGDLALSHGLPDADPARKRVLTGALRTFVGTAVLVAACVLGLAVGIGLGVWAMARFWSGRGRWGFAEHERALTLGAGSIWLETFAIYIGVMMLGGVAAGCLPEAWGMLVQAGAMFGAVVLGLLWPLGRGLSRSEFRAGFGWTRGRGWLREMVAGVAGYVTGLPILALGFVLTVLLTQRFNADASHPINHMAGSPPVILVLIGALAVVWAPFTEETFFRGAFFAAWRQRCGRWVSALATGVIFAAIHPQGWTAIPALGAIGLVLALIREWRGGVLASMTAHALSNGTVLTLMLLTMR